MVNAGPVIKTLHVAFGGKLAEVAVANFIFGQQNQVISLVVDFVGFSVVAVGGNVSFHADDGFDLVFFAGQIKLDGTKHVAMIGQGQSLLPQFGRPFGHDAGFHGTVKETVVGMVVQMHEIVGEIQLIGS